MQTTPTPKPFNKILPRLITLLTIGWLIFLLTGCINAETDITIYADESWAGTIAIVIPPETVSLIGGMAALEERLDESKQEARDNGVNDDAFAWQQNRDGSVSIDITGEGQGLRSLNRTFFDGDATISMNDRQEITIRQTYAPAMQTGSNVIKISGGRIIDSNADEVQGGTAIWRNPQRIEVTLTGASTLSTWLLWGAVGGGFLGMCCCGGVFLLLTGAGGFYWYRRQNQNQEFV